VITGTDQAIGWAPVTSACWRPPRNCSAG